MYLKLSREKLDYIYCTPTAKAIFTPLNKNITPSIYTIMTMYYHMIYCVPICANACFQYFILYTNH